MCIILYTIRMQNLQQLFKIKIIIHNHVRFKVGITWKWSFGYAEGKFFLPGTNLITMEEIRINILMSLNAKRLVLVVLLGEPETTARYVLEKTTFRQTLVDL